MLRRLILRRGLTALIGAAVASTSNSSNAKLGQSPMPAFTPSTGLAQNCANDDAESKMRQAWAKPLNEKLRLINKKHWLRWKAHNETDSYLLTLQSTSPAWRASVMYDRHRQRQSIEETLSERIDAIWQEPLGKLQSMVASWIRGDA